MYTVKKKKTPWNEDILQSEILEGKIGQVSRLGETPSEAASTMLLSS
jgi:hypothetical protein